MSSSRGTDADRPPLAADPEIAVETRALRKEFGEIVAVESLDITVRRGEVFGLLGPNGSGKTTTIRMLCGLLTPTSGDAMVVGFDVRLNPEAVRQRIGYMSQRFGLYDDLTVDENLRFYAAVYGLRGKVLTARVGDQLASFGLDVRQRQLAGTLSGGWKQRLALACATTHRPAMLFLDEPTAGVDPSARRHFWSLIHTLAGQGTAVLLTTHYMDEAERCERLAFMSRGHSIAMGTAEEIKGQFGKTSIEDVFIDLQRRDEGVMV